MPFSCEQAMARRNAGGRHLFAPSGSQHETQPAYAVRPYESYQQCSGDLKGRRYGGMRVPWAIFTPAAAASCLTPRPALHRHECG